MTETKLKPIAKVINNNQSGWKNIIETDPNVTLHIGEELYTAKQLATAKQQAVEEKAEALNYLKILYLDITNFRVDRIEVLQRLNEVMRALSQKGSDVNK